MQTLLVYSGIYHLFDYCESSLWMRSSHKVILIWFIYFLWQLVCYNNQLFQVILFICMVVFKGIFGEVNFHFQKIYIL